MDLTRQPMPRTCHEILHWRRLGGVPNTCKLEFRLLFARTKCSPKPATATPTTRPDECPDLVLITAYSVVTQVGLASGRGVVFGSADLGLSVGPPGRAGSFGKKGST